MKIFKKKNRGLKNRLSRIIKGDGRTLMLAVDHGYFLGPTTGLENFKKAVAACRKIIKKKATKIK